MFEESREFNHFLRAFQVFSLYMSEEVKGLLAGHRTQCEQLPPRMLFQHPVKQGPPPPFHSPHPPNTPLPVRPSPGVSLPGSAHTQHPNKQSHPSYNPSSTASLKRTLSSYSAPHPAQAKGPSEDECANTDQSHCHRTNPFCGVTLPVPQVEWGNEGPCTPHARGSL